MPNNAHIGENDYNNNYINYIDHLYVSVITSLLNISTYKLFLLIFISS